MDRMKVVGVIGILLAIVLAFGAYYGVIPTAMNNGTSAESNLTEENKAVLEGIPSEVGISNTSQTSYMITVTGVKGTTTQIYLQIIEAPTNVTAYFTTSSTAHWKITNNGTVAEYTGFPLYAGDVVDDLVLHIDAAGNPVSGKIVYNIFSNDVLVIKNDIETTVTAL